MGFDLYSHLLLNFRQFNLEKNRTKFQFKRGLDGVYRFREKLFQRNLSSVLVSNRLLETQLINYLDTIKTLRFYWTKRMLDRRLKRARARAPRRRAVLVAIKSRSHDRILKVANSDEWSFMCRLISLELFSGCWLMGCSFSNHVAIALPVAFGEVDIARKMDFLWIRWQFVTHRNNVRDKSFIWSNWWNLTVKWNQFIYFHSFLKTE